MNAAMLLFVKWRLSQLRPIQPPQLALNAFFFSFPVEGFSIRVLFFPFMKHPDVCSQSLTPLFYQPKLNPPFSPLRFDEE